MKSLFAKKTYEPPFNDLTPGTTVRIHQLIKEGEKSRTQVYEGMIIGRHGKKDVNATITVRRIATGHIGVERIFPVFSTLIQKIEIVKRAKNIRRAKLYFLRKIKGDSMNMPENQVKTEVTIHQNIVEEIVEAPKAEEAVVAEAVVDAPAAE